MDRRGDSLSLGLNLTEKLLPVFVFAVMAQQISQQKMGISHDGHIFANFSFPVFLKKLFDEIADSFVIGDKILNPYAFQVSVPEKGGTDVYTPECGGKALFGKVDVVAVEEDQVTTVDGKTLSTAGDPAFSGSKIQKLDMFMPVGGDGIIISGLPGYPDRVIGNPFNDFFVKRRILHHYYLSCCKSRLNCYDKIVLILSKNNIALKSIWII